MFESEHEPDMTDFSAMTIPELLSEQSHLCACGRSHDTELKYVRIESGAVRHLPEALEQLSVCRPFVVFDQNTYQAAGKKVQESLDNIAIDHVPRIVGIDGGTQGAGRSGTLQTNQ